jgi:competence ComEA-like helix-hairpin-helix protein
MRVHPRKPVDARKLNAENSTKDQTEWLGRIKLNVADAQAFQKLAGVGPVLSERIVRFRDALGGFSSVDDLYDVYGLDSSVVNRAKPVLSVDAELVRPLCLDTVSFRTLLKHPRFDLETTKKLMRARGRGVHALDAVLFRSRLDSLTLGKVRPYLEVCSSL